jgi:nucleoside 2-deoxyribosyltransferase
MTSATPEIPSPSSESAYGDAVDTATSTAAPIRIYLAGTLFNVREISGNVQLAEAIEEASCDSVQCVLPQELAFPQNPTPKQIRDMDLSAVLTADALVLEFDGLELDSGTVAEFMLAKAADIPCVLLRTDIRSGGDQSGPDAEPWNLMLSGWPRTRTVLVPSLLLWGASTGNGSRAERIAALYKEIGKRTVEALRSVIAETPVLAGPHAPAVREWLGRMAG